MNGFGQRSCPYRRNGWTWVFFGSQNANGGGFGTEQNLTVGGLTLAAGDYVEIGGFQNTGAAVDVTSCAATLIRARSA